MLRNVAVRVGLIAIGVLMSCVLVEVVLQIGAFYIRTTSDDGPSAWNSASAVRVLALGDSNTYGLYLADRAEAYPSVVETLWRQQRAPERPIEVINAGVPGTNSSRVRKDFQRLLEAFRPDVVTLMLGANDFWTEPVPLEDEALTLGNRLWSVSRLYRLFFMVRRTFQNEQAEVEFGNPDGYRPNRGTMQFGSSEFNLGWTNKSPNQVWQGKVTENLTAIAEIAGAVGVRTIFLTYPSTGRASYRWANHRIVAAAEALDVPLVESREVFSQSCGGAACDELFFPDQHPTALGHRLIAEALFDKLVIERTP